MKNIVSLRPVDRAIVFLLSALQLFTGVLILIPWHEEFLESATGQQFETVYHDSGALIPYSIMLLVSGVMLLCCSIKGGETLARVLSWGLMLGFVTRLYFITTYVAIEKHINPPGGMVSQLFIVAVFGVYWLWARGNERTP